MNKESNIVELELLNEEHANILCELVASNRAHLSPWFAWTDKMQTLEHFEKFVSHSMQRIDEGSELSFLIRFNGEPAGRIGIYNIDQANRSGSIGYWLGKSFTGKGIALQAARQIMEEGFVKMNLNRLEIRCAINNVRSKSIPEKLGFSLEGILREAELIRGMYTDLYLYAFLKSTLPLK